MLFLSIFGLLLSVILFAFNTGKSRSSYYLAGFFLLSSLFGLNIYALYYSESALLVSIVLMYNSYSIFLHGPMLYWYIRSTLTDNPNLRRSDAWHLVPAAVFFLISLPYLFIPWDEKLRIASDLVMNIDNNFMNRFPVYHPLIPGQMVVLALALHVNIYTFVSTWMAGTFLKSGKKNNVLSGQQVMAKWLMVFLGFLLILAVSDSILQIVTIVSEDSTLYHTTNLLRIFSTIGLTGFMISPLFFPSILYGLPRIPAIQETISVAGEPHPIEHRNEQKVKTPVLENEYLQQIGETITAIFRNSAPYLQPDFNMAKLSVLTGVPLHHLAYYFRVHLQDSFHDFRNKWRVEHSKKLIDEGKTVELTLEAIGQMSGFSSRNTFFIAFKRSEGISPGEYARRINSVS